MVNDKLLQYIASLSPEERERYKDLIEETIARDKSLADNFRTGRKNAERFAEDMKRIMEEALKLQASVSMINERLTEVRDTSRILSNMAVGGGPCMN